MRVATGSVGWGKWLRQDITKPAARTGFVVLLKVASDSHRHQDVAILHILVAVFGAHLAG